MRPGIYSTQVNVGCLYCLAPDNTTALQSFPGRKMEKQRITLIPCANAIGSEKIELMIVSNSVQPKFFKKKTGNELGLDYHTNKKAWMTVAFFLNGFNFSMTKLGAHLGAKQF